MWVDYGKAKRVVWVAMIAVTAVLLWCGGC